MHITVFLGSNPGNHPAFREAAEQFGTYLAEAGHTLVYGGSRAGLMGVLADSALAAGGSVIGVEPESFIRSERQHTKLTELIVVKNMAERKETLIARGDMYLAFPGGIGTLEEISEVLSRSRLNTLTKPLAFLNLGGYYDPLRQQMEYMAMEGFIEEHWLARIPFFYDLSSAEAFIDQLRKR